MEYKLATSTWGKEEIKAIQDVIDTDMFSMGPKVKEYERQFADFFGYVAISLSRLRSVGAEVSLTGVCWSRL